jgi:hypothetical protein
MEYKTTWNSIKNINTETNNKLFYSVENKHCSNDLTMLDIERYYIRIQDGINEFYCFVTIESPASTDQADFEDNYKSTAIET